MTSRLPNKRLYYLAYLLIIYEVWYELFAPHWPYKKPHFLDIPALIGFLSLLIIAAYTFIRSWWHKGYRRMFVPIVCYLLFQFRLFEGWPIVSINDCDMSVCTDVELRCTGLFWRSHWCEYGDIRTWGSYEVKDGVVHIYHDFRHAGPRFRKTLAWHPNGNGRELYYYDESTRTSGVWFDGSNH